eukprot:9907805-Alexandrium_andersonii.AAC.1
MDGELDLQRTASVSAGVASPAVALAETALACERAEALPPAMVGVGIARRRDVQPCAARARVLVP